MKRDSVIEGGRNIKQHMHRPKKGGRVVKGGGKGVKEEEISNNVHRHET